MVEELDHWEEAGRAATLWWRDDDAVAPSQALDRLMAIAGEAPIALAVIAATAQPDLGAWLSHRARSGAVPRSAVLQHGWSHSNHSAGPKKSEFPAERSAEDVARELRTGRERLSELFGPASLAVFVPPWNRFDDRFLPVLGRSGFFGISRAHPRRAALPTPGVVEANIHVDLVAWAGGRDFIGENAALSGLVSNLRARRLGLTWADEPTGILTHHLVQDAPTEAFLAQLVEVTGAHAAAFWLEAADVFAPVGVVSA